MDEIYLAVIVAAAMALGSLIGWFLAGWLLTRTTHNVKAADQERDACAQIADEANEWADTLLVPNQPVDARGIGFQQGAKYASRTIAATIRSRRPAP
jgi:hypothetical protein